MKRVSDASVRLAEGFALLRKDAARELATDASRVPELARRMAGELSAPTAATAASLPQGAALAGSVIVKGGTGLLILGAVIAAGWQLRPRADAPAETAQVAAAVHGDIAPAVHGGVQSVPEQGAAPVAAVATAEDAGDRTARRSVPRARMPARGVEVEAALIARARAAVLRRPADALQLCREHAALYPHGVFVQEREVLAIEALLGSRHRRAAEERAARFLVRFPRSSHAHRVQKLVVREQAGARTPAPGHARK